MVAFLKTKRLKNKSAQVAVEFILMFSIVSFIIFYIWKLCLTLSALQIREYTTFMVGRTITASASTYSEKKDNASAVMNVYNSSDSSNIASSLVSSLDCDIDPSGNGGRGLYWNQNKVDWFSVSDVGVVCGVKLSGVIPGGGPLDVVSESMTWSEISDAHCRCALQFDKTWKDCLKQDGTKKYTDNGC